MRYEVRVIAYDVFDHVSYAVTLNGAQEAAVPGKSWITLASGIVRGRGEDDPREWARDALTAVLEAL